MTSAPEVLCVGQPRLTAGLGRMACIDATAFDAVFGKLPRRTSAELIAMAQQVDLRGRGGAAFPVARKLAAVARSAHDRKKKPVILVNAAEGEPGSAKDRMLLLRTPYLVLGGALIAAGALRTTEILVAVTSEEMASWMRAVVRHSPPLRRRVQVVQVPNRFVTGEAGALVNAINGKAALPPGRKTRASDSGVRGLPTLLSNAETFAQLAVLAMLGPEGYASAGTPAEPGTLLLSVGGCAARPAVVEVPSGLPLGRVLDLCDTRPCEGVLVGGYHGMWLPDETAYDTPVSRAGLEAVGGTLGAGVVMPLGRGSCPLGEVARVAAYLAGESSGQCGPCRLGLPGIARSLAAVTTGSGGLDALDAARRTAAAVRGRGACAHPDGVSRFVQSALNVFSDDVAAHVFHGGCGRPVRGFLPVPSANGNLRLSLDWTRCRGHGLCERIVPEIMRLDEQGYPVMLDIPVPPWLERAARQATSMCPELALSLVAVDKVDKEPRQPAGQRYRSLPGPDRKRLVARTTGDLAVTEDWIAELTDARGRIQPVRLSRRPR
ncbi:MAG TPA: NADH-ubiquinone oxidoreductase-F iron-sulfur binding region domain-containing protein [Streptosporangiaceae bacterium]|nr:NADH-ubiquinone oxidoreductase-F iron-sulfur binding region domain-containing protein [Streptosporangiaceae bacterium]